MGGWDFKPNNICSSYVCPVCARPSLEKDWTTATNKEYEGADNCSVQDQLGEEGCVCPMCGEHSFRKDLVGKEKERRY